MYHDEFRKKPAKPTPRPEEPLSSTPMEVGGGLSLGLAASLNPPISLILWQIGGLLPLLACSVEIAARQAADALLGLARAFETRMPSVVPVPHLAGRPGRMAGLRLRRQKAGSAR